MKFKCQESCGGKCCSAGWDGKAGFVFLTSEDRNKLAAFLGKKVSDFAQQGVFDSTRFTDKKSIQWYLKDGEKSCQFLKDGKCSVYEARPTQCRTYPFWPEQMKKPQKEFCPGIGKGKEHNDDLLLDQVKADLELCP
jgi:Fe-S-cluster containining protein